MEDLKWPVWYDMGELKTSSEQKIWQYIYHYGLHKDTNREY